MYLATCSIINRLIPAISFESFIVNIIFLTISDVKILVIIWYIYVHSNWIYEYYLVNFNENIISCHATNSVSCSCEPQPILHCNYNLYIVISHVDLAQICLIQVEAVRVWYSLHLWISPQNVDTIIQ